MYVPEQSLCNDHNIEPGLFMARRWWGRHRSAFCCQPLFRSDVVRNHLAQICQPPPMGPVLLCYVPPQALLTPPPRFENMEKGGKKHVPARSPSNASAPQRVRLCHRCMSEPPGSRLQRMIYFFPPFDFVIERIPSTGSLPRPPAGRSAGILSSFQLSLAVARTQFPRLLQAWPCLALPVRMGDGMSAPTSKH
jgi:hypothetical protein